MENATANIFREELIVIRGELLQAMPLRRHPSTTPLSDAFTVGPDDEFHYPAEASNFTIYDLRRSY
jgi:hypothetical protein